MPAVGAVGLVRTSLLAGAALTTRLVVVERAFAASEAVSDCDPALISVAEKLRWPFDSVELAGSVADGSLLLKCRVPA